MTLLVQALSLTLFPAMMAFAASTDLLTMTIANRVSLILIGGFVLLAAMASHAGAAGAVLLAGFVCFACGWIGGGDAKLAAVTALWLGFGHLADYLVYASLLGGALTVLLIQFRAMPLPAVFVGREWVDRSKPQTPSGRRGKRPVVFVARVDRGSDARQVIRKRTERHWKAAVQDAAACRDHPWSSCPSRSSS